MYGGGAAAAARRSGSLSRKEDLSRREFNFRATYLHEVSANVTACMNAACTTLITLNYQRGTHSQSRDPRESPEKDVEWIGAYQSRRRASLRRPST